jgi:hypothetical protein
LLGRLAGGGVWIRFNFLRIGTGVVNAVVNLRVLVPRS